MTATTPLDETKISDEPRTNETRPARRVRLNWQLKLLLPLALILLNGLLLFLLVTVSLGGRQRYAVIVVATAGAFVIMAAFVSVLAVFVRRPMLELEEKIARVQEGDLNVEVDFAKRNDEMGDLGRNFNQMVSRLRESLAEIERLHSTQMSRAEHLATLGELAAGLAHEIRNPLAGIAGVMEVVSRDLPASSPANEVLLDVRQEIMHINRTISDLLETARPHPPEYRLADLNATAEHAYIFARQQALSKPIKVELQKAPDLPLVEHDSGQIHQVLLNLLLNAMQAIDGPGEVTLRLERRWNMAAVTVRDTGPGITPENLPNIFRPFFTTKGHGTGLGLSLAQRVAEDHGGCIEVRSEIGKGSEFTLLLPFNREARGGASS